MSTTKILSTVDTQVQHWPRIHPQDGFGGGVVRVLMVSLFEGVYACVQEGGVCVYMITPPTVDVTGTRPRG